MQNESSPTSRSAAGRRKILPVVELAALAAALVTPLLLDSRPELVTLATNVLILSMLAISFDLCWGYSGIMSFGQALFFGVAGYVVALIGRDLEFSHAWGTLPLAMLAGLLLAFAFAAFLLLGRRTPTVIFVAMACRPSSCCRSANTSSSRVRRSTSWRWRCSCCATWRRAT